MNIKLGFVFVSVWFSNIILVKAGFEIKTGHFKVLENHPKIKKCATDVLQQYGFVGGRISNQTGVCEGLSQSWSRNKTIEPGYGYVKNIYVSETFEPPFALVESLHRWTVSVTFNTGARADVHLTWIRDSRDTVNFGICFNEGWKWEDILSSYTEHPEFGFGFGNLQRVAVYEYRAGSRVENSTHIWNVLDNSKADFKISFLFQKNIIRILVDDKFLHDWTLNGAIRVENLRQLFVYRYEKQRAFVRRLEFTAE